MPCASKTFINEKTTIVLKNMIFSLFYRFAPVRWATSSRKILHQLHAMLAGREASKQGVGSVFFMSPKTGFSVSNTPLSSEKPGKSGFSGYYA